MQDFYSYKQPHNASSVRVSTMNNYIEIDIDRDITSPEDFREEIGALRQAREGDVCHILINCDGGSVSTANAIIAAMRQSKAHIITEIVGMCASAATLIFLEGHEYRVNNDIEWMQHTASYGYGGKANNVAEYVNFQQKNIRKLIETSYKHFLTDDEIERLLSGSDFWMNSEEVCERLRIRAEKLNPEPELTKEDLSSWSKERLLSFICDDNYDDADWEVDTECNQQSCSDTLQKFAIENNLDIVYDEKLGTVDICDGMVIIDKDGNVNFDGSTEFHYTDKFSGDVHYVRSLCDALSIEYKASHNAKVLVKKIRDFVEKVVAILNT